jgi:tRNA nucleotidyltransferase (CCA-adding enzyme)
MGRTPYDYDVATSALPAEVVAIFPRVEPTGLAYGTVTVIYDGKPFEVTTYRGDGVYSDGRRPDAVTFSNDVRSDLARRDFTMNAIAFDPVSKTYIDPFDGIRDIGQQVIRCVGDPDMRFAEDGLRVARAFRFASQLGFTIERSTLWAMRCNVHMLEKVAVERRAVEFVKFATGPHALHAACCVDSVLDLMPRLLGFKPLKPLDVDDIDRVPAVPLYRLAHLFRQSEPRHVEGYMRALKLETALIKKVPALMEAANDVALLYGSNGGWMARKFLSQLTLKGLTLDELAAVVGSANPMIQMLDVEAAKQAPLTVSALAIDGNIVAGIVGKGPQVGTTLKALLELVLEDPSLNTGLALLAATSQLHARGLTTHKQTLQ